MKKLLLMMFILLGTVFAVAQNYGLSGNVTSADTGEPLSFVTVIEKGTNRSTMTDDNGNFRLNISGLDAVVVFSSIGYKTIEMTVTGNVMIVKLEAESLLLEETVVVAYGTQRGTGSGSIGVVKVDDISKMQSTSVSQSLQGMSGGVQVFNMSGAPGSEGEIFVRGIGSFSASTSPLYVVDGAALPTSGYGGGLNMINPNDIESISILKDASSTALYGSRAANGVVMITTKRGRSEKPQVSFSTKWSTSNFAVPVPDYVGPEKLLELAWEGRYNDVMYGSVNVAGGQNDAAARAYASANVWNAFFEQVTYNGRNHYIAPFKYRDGSHVAEPVGLDGKFKYDELVNVFNDAPDWRSMFKTALRQDYDLSISGTANAGKTRYYISGSYSDDKGHFMSQRFQRYTARANVSSEVKPWLEVNLNLSWTRTAQDESTSASVRTVRILPTVWPAWLRDIDNKEWLYYPSGDLIPDMGVYRIEWRDQNPLMNKGTKNGNNPEDYSFSYSQLNQIAVRSYVQANIVKGLKWKTSFSVMNNQRNRQTFSSQRHTRSVQLNYVRGIGEMVAPSGNSANRAGNQSFTTTITNLLTYDHSFNKIHNISLLAGQEANMYHGESVSATGAGIPDLKGLYQLSNATRDYSVSGGEEDTRMMSWFSRVEYNFDQKYYIFGSVRADGSSRFHPDNRWGTFWSAAGSWRISEEKFMEGTRKWLNDLRLKASYGTTGNDRVATYAYQGTYSISDYNYVEAYNLNRIASAGLKWEKNIQFNVGADFRLFGRLSGSFEWYNRESQDLLFGRQVPLSLGWTGSISQNIGALKNTGVELSLNASIISIPDFQWNMNFNFTSQKNEITSLPDGDLYVTNRVSLKLTEGKSRYEMFYLSWAGIDPADGNNLYWKKVFEYDTNGEIVRNAKGDPVVIGRELTKNATELLSSNDYRDIQGSSLPWAFGSWTNNFRYKDFDLSFMFYYSLGGKMYDDMYREGTVLRTGFGLLEGLGIDDRWTPENTNATLARYRFLNEPMTDEAGNAFSVAQYNPSSQYIFDNTYVRMRNITLGYTVPKKVINKMGIGNIRVYVSSDNLLTLFSKAAKRGTDPEVSVLGIAVDGNGGGFDGGGSGVDGRWGPRRTFTGGIQITF